MLPQQYCLRWKHHHSNVQSMFSQLLEKERFCDVTLYCSASFGAHLADSEPDGGVKGVSLRAHRVVLAACSELLGSLLGAHEAQGEPVLVIDGAEPRHVRALLDYMYTGEMNVHHSQLASLLKTAEELRIKGLSDIRWNNKDEPPDCHTGAVTTTTELPAVQRPKKEPCSDADSSKGSDKFNVNGGPPPLIKLSKERSSPSRKRDPLCDTDSSRSPKRKRVASGTDITDDDEHDTEWQSNKDIKPEGVQWCQSSGRGADDAGADDDNGSSSGSDEWADAPADIGSFLHTKLKVDGDNSGDEDSMEIPSSGGVSLGPSAPVTLASCSAEPKLELTVKPLTMQMQSKHTPHKQMPVSLKAGSSTPSDPRFTDVVKLNEYLLHGRRPQFWEEDYVKRVMEAVRLKELEMKQAAEILGVSYGTLYGRYRDVYGCINRPYRSARDFWAAKGPSDIIERLQRGDVTVEVAAQALGVSPANLAAYISDLPHPAASHHDDKDFEPIPIEIDPSLKMKSNAGSSSNSGGGGASASSVRSIRKNVAAAEKAVKRILIGNLDEDEPIPATVISGKWPTIRVANIESLRGAGPASADGPAPSATSPAVEPSVLMKSRPDLTIVAAKRPDKKEQENGT